MPIAIELPSLLSQTEFNLSRWAEILADRDLAKLPYRVETDRQGHILMTPPAGFRHSRRLDNIIALLHSLMPKDQTLPEGAVSTADGVKAVDVAWLSHDRPELHDEPLVLSRAPDVCIEIFSPSNSAAEIVEKRTLHFDAGATEVWICNLDGSFSFFVAPTHQQTISNLCPDFPLRIL